LSLVRVPIVFLTLALTGCIASEAFPTIIDNRSKHPITVRYHHEDYPSWSATWTIPSNEAQSFARDHWVQDIVSIQIQDGKKLITLGALGIQTKRSACNNSLLGRRLKLAGDCYVIYSGNGRWTATSQTPSGLYDRLNKSLE